MLTEYLGEIYRKTKVMQTTTSVLNVFCTDALLSHSFFIYLFIYFLSSTFSIAIRSVFIVLQTKETYPTRSGSPTPCKQDLSVEERTFSLGYNNG